MWAIMYRTAGRYPPPDSATTKRKGPPTGRTAPSIYHGPMARRQSLRGGLTGQRGTIITGSSEGRMHRLHTVRLRTNWRERGITSCGMEFRLCLGRHFREELGAAVNLYTDWD